VVGFWLFEDLACPVLKGLAEEFAISGLSHMAASCGSRHEVFLHDFDYRILEFQKSCPVVISNLSIVVVAVTLTSVLVRRNGNCGSRIGLRNRRVCAVSFMFFHPKEGSAGVCFEDPVDRNPKVVGAESVVVGGHSNCQALKRWTFRRVLGIYFNREDSAVLVDKLAGEADRAKKGEAVVL
jgi:hypothetical protein